jgi:hypothetical protein
MRNLNACGFAKPQAFVKGVAREQADVRRTAKNVLTQRSCCRSRSFSRRWGY